MKLIFKIAAGIIVALVLVIGGCSAIVGGAINEVDKEMTAEQEASSITQKEFKSVKIGTPLAEVKERFGEPTDVQESESDGYKSVTIYYNVSGGEFLDSYQFSFEGGKLESKSKW